MISRVEGVMEETLVSDQWADCMVSCSFSGMNLLVFFYPSHCCLHHAVAMMLSYCYIIYNVRNQTYGYLVV